MNCPKSTCVRGSRRMGMVPTVRVSVQCSEKMRGALTFDSGSVLNQHIVEVCVAIEWEPPASRKLQRLATRDQDFATAVGLRSPAATGVKTNACHLE